MQLRYPAPRRPVETKWGDVPGPPIPQLGGVLKSGNHKYPNNWLELN